MFMEKAFSKGENCAWLAQQLKKQMGESISLNQFGIDSSMLAGVYVKNGINSLGNEKENIKFYMKFRKNEFLRIQIKIDSSNSENIIDAMSELIEALVAIQQGNTSIGFPLAIYETSGCLTSEYAFKDLEAAIESLKKNSMRDDGSIENLRFLRTCNNCTYGSYGLEVALGKETLYCTDGGCDTETQKNETCINHEFEDGEEPDIKVLCRSIFDNKK